jgi:hypothetical protein
MRHKADQRTVKLSERHRTSLSSVVKSGSDQRVRQAIKTIIRDRAPCALERSGLNVFTERGPGAHGVAGGD